LQAASDLVLGFDALEYDGSLFALFDAYKAERLASARRLRVTVAATRALGDLVTGDLLAEGEAVDRELELRTPLATYPPLYLTFTDHPEWVAPTDVLLVTFRRALERRPKMYKGWVQNARRRSMGGIFELNVFGLLDGTFPPAEAQPPLPNSRKHADAAVAIRGCRVFFEATVIGEPQWEVETRERMLRQGRKIWGGSAPGPDAEAHRLARKVEEELRQTAENFPNVLCVSFFDHSPSNFARDWFFEDLFRGAPKYGTMNDGTTLDFANVARVDSFALFGRDRLTHFIENPLVADSSHLPDDARQELRAALASRLLMVR